MNLEALAGKRVRDVVSSDTHNLLHNPPQERRGITPDACDAVHSRTSAEINRVIWLTLAVEGL